jgi:hypothetical protein
MFLFDFSGVIIFSKKLDYSPVDLLAYYAGETKKNFITVKSIWIN